MPETRERAALEVLRSVEWAGLEDHPEGGYYGACPRCGGGDPDNPAVPKGHVGHAPDCALDAVLRATPASDGGEVRGAIADADTEFCDMCLGYFDPEAPGAQFGSRRDDDGLPAWSRCPRCARAFDAGYAQSQSDPQPALLSGSGTPPGEGEATEMPNRLRDMARWFDDRNTNPLLWVRTASGAPPAYYLREIAMWLEAALNGSPVTAYGAPTTLPAPDVEMVVASMIAGGRLADPTELAGRITRYLLAALRSAPTGETEGDRALWSDVDVRLSVLERLLYASEGDSPDYRAVVSLRDRVLMKLRATPTDRSEPS